MFFTPYRNQVYETLKAQCLAKGTLFEDPEFPAIPENIIRFKTNSKNLVWKRPKDLTKWLGGLKPIFVDTISIDDLDQGSLGDCWLITAIANICQYPEYANVVIPQEGQSFDDGQYAGIFHFRIWKWGNWFDVVVDDRIPVSVDGTPQYCHNKKTHNEFYGALLEKAFAKIAGCYEVLANGESDDGMTDLTGGVHENYDLICARANVFSPSPKDNEQEYIRTDRAHLWEILFQSKLMKSLVGTFTSETKNNELVLNHAYSVLNVFEILAPSFDMIRDGQDRAVRNDSIKLVLVRNPWGNQKWSGAWGANSNEWSLVNQNIKNYLLPNLTEDNRITNYFATWQMLHFWSGWVAGINAGGCGNDDPVLYWVNPQFFISLPPTPNSLKRSLIISLLNIDSERLKMLNQGNFSASNPSIHFTIYRVNNPTGYAKQSKYLASELTKIGSTGIYQRKREISRRFFLDPGEYIIVPSLFRPHINVRFLLRLFAESYQENIVAVEIFTNSVHPQPRPAQAQQPNQQHHPHHSATDIIHKLKHLEVPDTQAKFKRVNPFSVACSVM